jgi:hypothetical protein
MELGKSFSVGSLYLLDFYQGQKYQEVNLIALDILNGHHGF